MSNADNPKIGASFQEAVQQFFSNKYGPGFELEQKLPIGSPPKDHKFDIVNFDKRIVVECKRFTWTETGNVPSAKIRTLNEAVLYLRLLQGNYEKFIVMYNAHHPKKRESLADYYYRMNNHLLGKVILAEYDPDQNVFRIIGQNDADIADDGFFE